MVDVIGFDTAATRKARGAFFTPEPVARFVTEWAVRSPDDVVFEPSCGEAAFLLAAADRLQGLGAHPGGAIEPALLGHELHAASARTAHELVAAGGANVRISVGDFFDVPATPIADAVTGNPPYVRFHGFTGHARARSRAAALQAGVRLSALASSWAAFTVHAAGFLKPGGRLGLVLPAELLTVNYAAEVRRFLMERFARVQLIAFTERVFPGVLEEVVLLLAEGDGPTDHFEFRQVRSADELFDLAAGVRTTWRPRTPEGRWSEALVPSSAASVYRELTEGGSGFTGLQTWGETTLGMVTGSNGFFAVSPARASELSLPVEDLLTLSPPGSRHLRGLSFTSEMRRHLGEEGASTLLFRPPGEPSTASTAYIAAGRAMAVDQAYKARVRKPWWRVPYVPPADLLLTCMNADTPRLTTNLARSHHLNSVHGVYLDERHQVLGRQLLPLASLSSATLLGAEIVGRAYGGGMLKLEPREADLLPVPSPDVVEAAREPLKAIRDLVSGHLRQRKLAEAARLVDEVLLVDQLRMSVSDVSELAAARAMLAARRKARGMRRGER